MEKTEAAPCSARAPVMLEIPNGCAGQAPVWAFERILEEIHCFLRDYY
ncbi:hypothetical protein AB0J63_10300 [Streptosporangium canum]